MQNHVDVDVDVDQDEDDWENCDCKINTKSTWDEDDETFQAINKKQSEQDRLKALQQKLVEDADNELAEDLFNGVGKKLANVLIKRPDNPQSMSLKTKEDYINFAEDCAKQVNSATSLQLYEFYKTLFLNLSGHIASEHTRLLIKHLEGTVLNKNIPQKKVVVTKKEIEKNNARHAEIFGEAETEEVEHRYARYVFNYDS